MYATSGSQPYVLPFRILHDSTSRGPLWDPLLNIYAYTYNSSLAQGHDREIRSIHAHDIPASDSNNDPALNPFPDHDPLDETLLPSSLTPNAPTSWFYYRGHWGDRFLPRSDHRQYAFGPEKAYVSGPMGPRFKALGRKTVCPSDTCVLKDSIARRSLAVELFIDYLYLMAILWLLAGLAVMVTRAVRGCVGFAAGCGCGGKGEGQDWDWDWEWWGKKAEADADLDVDVDVEGQEQEQAGGVGPSEVNERSALLGGMRRAV